MAFKDTIRDGVIWSRTYCFKEDPAQSNSICGLFIKNMYNRVKRIARSG